MGSWGCFCFAASSRSRGPCLGWGLSTGQPLLGLPQGTETVLCSCLVHQPGPGGGFMSGTGTLMLSFPYYSIFV